MAMAMVVSDDQGHLSGIRALYGLTTMSYGLMCFAIVAARIFLFLYAPVLSEFLVHTCFHARRRSLSLGHFHGGIERRYPG